MRRSNRLLILIGVFLAVLAMVGVIALSGGGGGGGGGQNQPKGTPTPTPEPKVAVVIAKTNINLGDKITADMLTTEQLTISAVAALPGDTYSQPSSVVGKVAGGTIDKGDILYADTSFLQPGTFVAGQDLASGVASGKVAVSMEVDQVNGVGALLVPGDHVDIILSVWVPEIQLSQTTSNGIKVSVGGGQDVTTKMVIQNRKVLATLLPPPQENGNVPASVGSGAPVAKPTPETIANAGSHMIVVVEVLPEEAEVIRWAQREEGAGTQNYITLGLALRSDKDDDAPNASTLGITFKDLVARYGVLPLDPRAIIPPDLAAKISW